MVSLSQQIKHHAQELGFSMLGITPALPAPGLEAYLDWIAAGMHGEMGYLARGDRIIWRKDLTAILPGARSLIVVGLDYATLELPPEIARDPLRGRISNYAWGTDYHDLMLAMFEELASFVRAKAGDAVGIRAYVDTGAILERSHAAQAGLGFVGKNTMLIHPRRGSYFFLGELITDLPLDYDSLPVMPGCGTCTRCLDACPTAAFPGPYVLDARRCISYLTIEYKGGIPLELRPLMGNWVYGCDVCQQVCPWGRFTRPALRPEFYPADPADAAPLLADLLSLTDESFRARYSGSPIHRIKRDRLVRNACIAAGNSGAVELVDRLLVLLDDQSPLVRGHAAWALGCLDASRDLLAAALTRETDEQVRTELGRFL